MSAIQEGDQAVRIQTDPITRFPLLIFKGIPFAVMWLPFTRIQLELFLSDVNDIRYDANWYTRVYKNNPRVSPNYVNRDNLKGILATNLELKEARRIADWYGHTDGQIYDLPTAEQWQTFVGICQSQPVQPIDQIPSDLDPRVGILLRRMQEIIIPRNLADQMLLLPAISEYVYQDKSRQTCQITGGRQNGFTMLRSPLDQVGDRQPNLTFRLIRRNV